MSKRMRNKDGSARWVDRSETIDSIGCTISFFEPQAKETSMTAELGTPDRALPSIEHNIKHESPACAFPSSANHNTSTMDDFLDLLASSLPQLAIKEESNEDEMQLDQVPLSKSTRPSFKEESDQDEMQLDQVPLQSCEADAITQLQQFAKSQETPRRSTRDIVYSEEQFCNHPGTTTLEDEEFESDSMFLLETFHIGLGLPPRNSRHLSSPLRKTRKRTHDFSSTPDRPSLASPLRPQQTVASASDADFFRQQASQLPKKHKPHEWTFEKREAICLIHMFYEVGVDTAFDGITRILNEYFKCGLLDYFRPLQVRTQWCTWRYTFRKRPVYDPKHEWLLKREGYEAAALRARVKLTPRKVPLEEKRLNPKFKKAAERVATQDTWFLSQLLSLRNSSRHYDPVASSNGLPLASQSPSEDDTIVAQSPGTAKDEEAIPSTPNASPPVQNASSQGDASNAANQEKDDLDNPPTPYRPAQASIAYAAAASQEEKDTYKPALLYRVYHDKSGGSNSPTHFKAGFFNIPGESLEPPPTDRSILPVFVSWHLWHHSVSSPFISCTDSLIMAIHKARQAEQDGLNPHLSIIDANTAMADGRGFPAGPLVVEARKRHLVPGMRYRGLREYLIWGEIPWESIIYDLPFHVLRTLTSSDLGVADLLALDDIDPTPRISLGRIRRSLLGQEVVLDESAGHVVGRLVALFGLGTLSPPAAIAQFVYDLFQGWVLGVHRVWAMADEFVAGLKDAEARAGSAMVVLDDSEEADMKAGFIDGALRAQRALVKERRSLTRK